MNKEATGGVSKKERVRIIDLVRTSINDFKEEIKILMEKDSGQGKLNPVLLRTFEELNCALVRRMEDVYADLDKDAQRILKKYFRSRAGALFFSSVMLKKGFEKKRGYPGDFEMMNYVYNNVPVSDSRLGQYFDRAFLDNGYARAVRGRKNKMKEILSREIASAAGDLRIFNLPCGPAREISELLDSPFRPKKNVEIISVDQDKDALDFAKKSVLQYVGNISAKFRQGNILDYIKFPEKYSSELSSFDVVYSIGIADYLPDKILERFLRFLFGLLKDGGRMYFAYKIHGRDTRSPLQPKWYCDWQFVPREIKDAEKNFQAIGISPEKITIEWEETGTIAFLKAEK